MERYNRERILQYYTQNLKGNTLKETLKKYDYETMPMGAGKLSTVRNNHLEKCLSFLSEFKTGRMLDIGCGGGRFINLLKSFRKEFVCFGTDISKNAISIASEETTDVNFVVSDITNLPFKQESVHIVLAFDVFEHISDVKKTIHNIYFPLKKNGIMIAYIPCEGEPFTLYWLLSKLKIGDKLLIKHFGHIQSFQKAEIEDLLKDVGFKIIEKSYSDHLISQIIGFFIWVLPKEILSWFGNKAVIIGTENFEYIYNTYNMDLKQKCLLFIKKIWLKLIYPLFTYTIYYQNKFMDRNRFTARGLYIKCIKK